MNRLAFLVGLLVACVSADALVAFTANIRVYYDPKINGAVDGTMTYQYDGTNNYKKLEFTLANGASTFTYTKIYNYTDKGVFSLCPAGCKAEMLSTTLEKYFPLSTETSGAGTTCVSNNRGASNSDDAIVYAGFMANGVICYAVYGSGRRIEFSGVTTRGSLFPASTWSYATWGCPVKTCNSIMDLVLILDVSGSIDDAAWASLKQFSGQLATAFKISATAVEFGVVAFSTDANLVLDISSSPTDVQNAIKNNIPRMQQSTCIGCGVYTAIDSFARVGSTRKSLNPKNVTIMITDGGNNINGNTGSSSGASGYLSTALSKLKAAPYNTISIVVAVHTTDYNANVLAQISSGTNYVLEVSGYTALMTIINQVVTATCSDYQSPTCDATCKGFCACGETCVCPNVCPTGGNHCIESSCKTVGGVLGCSNSTVNCDDGMACTTDSCDVNGGCVHELVKCTSTDKCANPTCSNATGCYTQPVVCPQLDECHTFKCNSGTGVCDATEISCSAGNPCIVCAGTTGCAAKNYCTLPANSCNVTSCSVVAGAATCLYAPKCTDTTCSIASCSNGDCSYAARACDDGDFCTDDYCDPTSTKANGCTTKVHSCDDGNPCTVDKCDSIAKQCTHDSSTTCDDGYFCTNDFCTPTNGKAVCSHTPVTTCDNINFTLPVSHQVRQCYHPFCVETVPNCVWKFVPSPSASKCAPCRVGNENKTGSCSWHWGISDTAGLAAGAIAGIIIAAIIGFLLFSAVSAAGTWKLIQMRNASKGMAAHNNPMYSPSEREANNPTYAPK